MIKRKKKVKRVMPPRYTSGPKKGKFMSKRAVAAKRARAKTKRNPHILIDYKRAARKAAAAARAKRKASKKAAATRAKHAAEKKRADAQAYFARVAARRAATKSNPKRRKARSATTSTRSKTMAVRRRRRVRRNFMKAAVAGAKRHHASPKRKAAARKAAATRAAKHAKRSAAAKKAARTRKRHAKGGSVKRHKKFSHAYYVALGKKGAAARKRKHGGKKAVRKTRRRRKVRSLGTVTRRRPAKVSFKKRKGGKIYRRRLVVSSRKSRKTGRRSFGLHVRRNPGASDFKNMLMVGGGIFAGFLGMKILSNALKVYVIPKIRPATTIVGSTTDKALNLLPAGVAFLAAAFAGKVIKNTKVVQAVQAGATINLFVTLFDTFVKPAVATNPKIAPLLAGVDDVGIQGYANYSNYGYGRVGEYLPRAPQQLNYGMDVHEAMALDEYVPAQGMGGYGMNVEEALAESEVEGIQRGYAAGSLSRTSLSS